MSRGLSKLVVTTSRQRGQALVLFTFFLVVLLLFLTLILDLGFAYGQKRSTQNLADNASLVGSDVVGKGMVCSSNCPDDTTVTKSICAVASNSDSAWPNATLCGGSGTYGDDLALSIQASYLASDGNTVVGSVGSGGSIPSGTQGVLVVARKASPGFFAQVMGTRDFPVTSRAAAMANVLTSYNESYPNFGPFAVWYTQAHLGSSVTYQGNNWCGIVAPFDPNCANSNNFKGDINHGTGWVSVGDVVSDGGNAIGQYKSMLLQHCQNGWPLIMPVVNKVDGNGNDIHITVIGFVAVALNQTPGSSPPNCDHVGDESRPNTGTVVSINLNVNEPPGAAPTIIAIPPNVRQIGLTR